MLVAIDPGHGMGAATPGVLDEGVTAQWHGERYTEQGLALVYGVALDEALREHGLRTALLRADSRTECPMESRRSQARGAEMLLSLHFAGDFQGRARGFQVRSEQQDLAWGIFDALSDFLPWLSGPRPCVSGSVVHGHDGLAAEIVLGHLTSDGDMQLLTEGYFKLRVCDSLAKLFQKRAARSAAA